MSSDQSQQRQQSAHFDFLTGQIVAGPSWQEELDRKAAERQKKRESLAAKRRNDLERCARERVEEWRSPQKEDYDFFRGDGWAKGARKELLTAGCVYEFARESRRLRSLLVMMMEARKRHYFEAWLFQQELEVDGRLGGALSWLARFAGELAANRSFKELLQRENGNITQLLVGFRHRTPPAVQLAIPLPFDFGPPPWPWRQWSALGPNVADITAKGLTLNLPKRDIDVDGAERIAIDIRWGDFNDKEIAAAMRKFAHDHRPPDEKCKEPKRRGQRPGEIAKANLKSLATVRIGKLHKRNPWKRLALVAASCNFMGCVKELREYKDRCRQGRADTPMSKQALSEMSDARARAWAFIQRFSSGEAMSNW